MFALTPENRLIEMNPKQFAQEDLFQKLLVDHPNLLSGGKIDELSPQRWILVGREKSIPDQQGGSARWSIDHLFLDQDGIPTFVEVKRQSDTRIRREVVGQMLDYAANAVEYWPVNELQELFVKTCSESSSDPDEVLRKHLDVTDTGEYFWQRVKTNIQAGKVRLLFVADLIPRELRRVVEFLNKQMDPAEVLALELCQYEGENGLRMLVPTLYGKTEEAQQRKAASSEARSWNEEMMFAELERKYGSTVLPHVQQLISWMQANAEKVQFGKGITRGSVWPVFERKFGKLYPITADTANRLWVNFCYILKGPFEDIERRAEWLEMFNQIDGVDLTGANLNGTRSIELALLKTDKQMDSLLHVLDWFVQQISTE